MALSLTASLVVGWAYVHTDEIPVIFSGLIAIGFLLGFAFPRFWPLTWVLIAAPCPIDELLITNVHLRAPFEGGHPWTACVALVPALIGTAIGRASRKLQ